MLKQINAPHLGHSVKMGRTRDHKMRVRLPFSRYAAAALPTPPATCSYADKALTVLEDIMGNDQLGDCVCACGGHLVGVATGNAGSLYHASLSQIIKMYSAIGGYVPGDESTDQGCNETVALDYWTQTGFPNGTKALGWLAVDATNATEIKQAMWLFENLVFGIELPDQWISPFPSGDGFTWDAAGAPDEQNGHCVLGVGYNGLGVQVDSWGLIGTVTWAAIRKYCIASANGELYVLVTPDMVAKGQTRAPNGIDWSALLSDFNALGGHVPVPAPPVPVQTPTLRQLEMWSNAGLRAHYRQGLTLPEAEAAAAAGLAANWLRVPS